MALATGMLTRVIDPDSAVPPYEQVAKMLRDEIAQGTMTGPGQRKWRRAGRCDAGPYRQ
jgi:hypothetical protein